MMARLVAWTAVILNAAAVGFAILVSTLPGSDSLGPATSNTYTAVVGAATLLWALTGALLITLRPRNSVGWLVLFASGSAVLALGAYGGYGAAVADPPWPGAAVATYLTCALFVPGWVVPQTVLLVFYPGGSLPARWWRWPVVGTIAGGVLFAVVSAFSTETHAYFFPGQPPALHLSDRVSDLLLVGVCLPVLGLSALAIWIGTCLRLVRAQSPERQQLALLLSAEAPLILSSVVAPSALSADGAVALSLFSGLLPVAVALGVMRYRMLGVEILLRRGLVYGTLTVAVIAVYLAATAVVGTALDRRPLPGVVAAALVSVLFAPARNRLQQAAERFVYGARKDPLHAMTQFGLRVATAEEPELLSAALAHVVRAVRASGAAVSMTDGRVICALGTGLTAHDVPLRVGRRDIGTLHLAAPASRPLHRYRRSERRLLAALSPQVAVQVRALQLTEALEAERDRVVVAVRAERDRLRRDLHDGLGPSLSGVGLGLQALTDLLGTQDPSAGKELLSRMRDEVDIAVKEIRRIIDGLRPTVLDAVGLVTAVRRRADTTSAVLHTDVVAQELPCLAAEVETAAYFIVSEALTNTVRHAHARHATVTLAVTQNTHAPASRPSAGDTALRITVSDDGQGAGDSLPGVGLTSMHRRAQSLGGTFSIDSSPRGTVVTATLPLEFP